MIQYIKGVLTWKGENDIIVENQGIGFHMSVPASVWDRMPAVGKEVKVYTYLHVREDLLQLFGFLSRDDLEVFKLLITVNGIGPRGGLSILSIMTPDELRFAVLADDAKAIAKTPGIGAKTAGKLILELKDKLKLKDVVEEALDRGEAALQPDGGETSDSEYSHMMADAVEALTALGYSSSEALKAVRSVERTQDMTVEMLLKLSLKQM